MMKQTKPQQRKSALAWRNKLTISEVVEQSQKLADLFKRVDVDWSSIVHVHCYRPLVEARELDPSYFVHQIRVINPKVKVYLQDVVPVFPELQFDLVVVPCVAVDVVRNRIGFGQGAYDKFLAKQTQAWKVGLVYEESVLDAINAEKHDIQLDVIVTPQRVINST